MPGEPSSEQFEFDIIDADNIAKSFKDKLGKLDTVDRNKPQLNDEFFGEVINVIFDNVDLGYWFKLMLRTEKVPLDSLEKVRAKFKELVVGVCITNRLSYPEPRQPPTPQLREQNKMVSMNARKFSEMKISEISELLNIPSDELSSKVWEYIYYILATVDSIRTGESVVSNELLDNNPERIKLHESFLQRINQSSVVADYREYLGRIKGSVEIEDVEDFSASRTKITSSEFENLIPTYMMADIRRKRLLNEEITD